MGRHAIGHKLNYISGITLANSKKFFKYHFREFFHSAVGNPKKWRYDIYVLGQVKIEEDGVYNTYDLEDCFDLSEFKEYWGNGFHIIIMDCKHKN